MLTSITPLGERSRDNRYAVTLTAYVLGCLLSGAAIGLLLGAVGGLLPVLPALVLAGIACLAAALADARIGKSDHGEGRQPERDVDLHLHRKGLDAEDDGRAHAGKHGRTQCK